MAVKSLKKSALLEAIETVKPGVAKKEILEQSNCFVFRDNFVYSFNDEVGMSHPIKDLKLKLSGAVNAESLMDLLASIEADSVSLETTKTELLLSSGKMKAGLPLIRDIALPLDSIGDADSWHPIPKNFIKGVSFSLFSCSKDVNYGQLTCVYVNTRRGVIETTDQNRACSVSFGKSLKGYIDSFLLPSDAAKKLVDYDLTEIGRSDSKDGSGWIHFRNDSGTIFSARIYEGSLPDSSSWFDVKKVGSFYLPENLGGLVERANVFSKRDAENDSGHVMVRVENGKLRVVSKGTRGWSKESIPVKHDKNLGAFNFSVSVDFIRDVLDIGMNEKCIVSDNCLLFEGKNWKHVMSLATED